jgi:uncharacterized protein (TIGR04141 family)
LSHLFLHASNSCELLRRSAPAREQLADLVRKRCANNELADAINAQHADLLPHRGEIEVVFAFLGMWRDRTIKNLPLFSRISLLQESKRMKSMGFHPSVALISCF